MQWAAAARPAQWVELPAAAAQPVVEQPVVVPRAAARPVVVECRAAVLLAAVVPQAELVLKVVGLQVAGSRRPAAEPTVAPVARAAVEQ